MLMACLGKGISVITNAAREPEIIDLQNFLNRMGAKIKGAGSSKIEIEGVKTLKDVSYNIMPDRIEAGTFLCLGSMTNSRLKIKNVEISHIVPIIDKLEEAGCRFDVEKKQLEVLAPKKLKAVDIKTMPYPGFPTDMQSIFVAMLTISKGSSIIVENVFENRFRYTQELIKMGAKITVDGRTAVIKGVRKLYGANVETTDLRGGAALLIAGLSAKGVTTVEKAEYILRGYENIDKKLQKIGAEINFIE